MNVFNLVIAAIIAIAVIYFLGTSVAPVFTPETNISAHANALLLEAQSDTGQGKNVVLSLKPGQTLYARNLDSSTRTVAFACSTPNCCPTLTNCPKPLSATTDRIMVNQNVKTHLTARCEQTSAIHACKVYVGDIPAQVGITNVSMAETIELSGVTSLPITATVRNSGATGVNSVFVEFILYQTRTFAGEEREEEVAKQTEQANSMGPGSVRTISTSIPLIDAGNYTVRIRAYGTDAGIAEENRNLRVTGQRVSLCARDANQPSVAQLDSFENVCRTKLYCTGCDFAFECRNAWKTGAPVESPEYYDEERGEPGFAYLITPAENGTC